MADDRAPTDLHEQWPRAERSARPASPILSAGALSTREAATALGVSEQAVRQAIARGELTALKQGRTYRIRQEDLAAYRHRRARPDADKRPARIVALPALAAVPALPVPGSPFVGREADLAALVALLTDPAVRLVTLTGPGGIGKTRLALEAAAAVRGTFPDGAVFVDLSTTTRPQLLVSTIAQTLGLRERTGQDRRRQLLAYSRGKRLLLILDNFEQVVAAAPEVARLVAEASGVSVLVTSRAPLHVGAEREWPVPPLSLAGASAAPAELLASDAGRLFVERTQAHDPSFTVDEASAPLIADICARLEGLPLAIELAAARCKVLPPRHLRDRLQQRLPLLTGGAREAPARLRTMRDAIAWSYDLLSPEEQRLFRRLAVFAGGFTLEAAEWVAGGSRADAESQSREASPSPRHPVTPSPSPDTLDLTGSLLDQSLLVRELGPEGEPRFRMLETIREYGLERLQPEEEAAVRAAHAHYFLRVAQTLRPLANTQSTRAPLDRLAADDANLGAALAWLDGCGQAADLARMVAACWIYWFAFSRLHEAESWLERALTRIGAATERDRARLLISYAELLMVKGESAAAARAFADGLPVVRHVGDPFDLAMALISYGASLNHGGKYAEGESQLGEAFSLAETISDRRLQAAVAGRALANLSDSARGLGDLDLATARGEEALRWYHGQGLELAETRLLIDLANIARDQGNYPLAAERYRACIARTGDRGELRLVADSLAGIASAVTAWGQPRAALLLFGAADALRERVGIGMSIPIDAARVERDLAALRTAKGEQAVAALLDEGRALPVADAIALAAAITPPGSERPVSGAAASAPLTRRERDVLGLLAEARTDREIAAALFLSPHTVSWHVRGILAKLGAASRREAIALARAQGWV